MPRLLSLLLCIAMLASVCGCTGFYDHRIEHDEFTIYSDQEPTKLRPTETFLGQAIPAFRDVFAPSGADVPPPRVVYHEEEHIERGIYTADVRQEGYYLPLMRLIHLSPQLPGEAAPQSETVILHELTHHFLISSFPESSRLYWLNEGLACALEVSYFDAAGELHSPLFHTWLHAEASRTLEEIGEEEFVAQTADLLDCGWFHFHQKNHKTRHYALAWVLTYRLMQLYPGTIEEQMATILALPESTLREVIDSLPAWLSETKTADHLRSIAAQGHHTLWALERWVESDAVYAPHFLRLVEPILASEDSVERARGYSVLTKAFGRRFYGLPRAERAEVRALIAARLDESHADDARAICEALDRRSRHPEYLRPLVELIDTNDADLRVAAAQALSRLAIKPTVTSPTFWRSAPAAERHREVEEWRQWLTRLEALTAQR